MKVSAARSRPSGATERTRLGELYGEVPQDATHAVGTPPVTVTQPTTSDAPLVRVVRGAPDAIELDVERNVLTVKAERRPTVETEHVEISRITVVVDVEDLPLEQVTKQLNKLINVVKIVELEPSQSVQREHLLVKVRVDNSTRSQILEAATLFRARVVDVTTDALVIEVTGDSAKCQALLRLLEPYGIKEIAQSGLLAIGRGGKSISERVLKGDRA